MISLVRPDQVFAPDVLDYSRDPEFFYYLESSPMLDENEALDFIDGMISDNQSGKRDYWCVRDDESGKIIGTIGFIFYYNHAQGVADMGYGISRDYWGTGAFQEAGRKLLDYGFDELSLCRIQVTTVADNLPSIKGVEKLGFKKETVLHDFCATNKGRKDGVLLYILK